MAHWFQNFAIAFLESVRVASASQPASVAAAAVHLVLLSVQAILTVLEYPVGIKQLPATSPSLLSSPCCLQCLQLQCMHTCAHDLGPPAGWAQLHPCWHIQIQVANWSTNAIDSALASHCWAAQQLNRTDRVVSPAHCLPAAPATTADHPSAQEAAASASAATGALLPDPAAATPAAAAHADASCAERSRHAELPTAVHLCSRSCSSTAASAAL